MAEENQSLRPITILLVACFAALQVISRTQITLVWAAGLALALMLLNPRRLSILAALFLTGSAARLAAGQPFVESTAFMISTVAEAWACAWLIGQGVQFVRVREVILLIGAAVIVNGGTTFVGAGLVALSEGSSFWTLWTTWWIPSALSVLIITPLIVTWLPLSRAVQWKRVPEFACFLVVWGLASWLSFQKPKPETTFGPQPYLLFPLIAYAAFRFRQRGVVLALAILLVIAFSSDAVISGPLVWGGRHAADRLLLTQMYLASISATGLLLAASYADRKAAERAARASETHYHSLFENMLNGFAYCKMHFEQGRPVDFTYLDVNPAFESLTGLHNAIGKRVSAVIPDIQKSDPKLFEIYGRVALTGQAEQFEMYVDGLKMWFSVSVYCPEKEHFVALFDVITERKQMEEERQATIEMLNLINNSPDNRTMLRTLLDFFKDWSGCEAVGIRFQEGDDFPYFETRGFPAEFVELERYLCAHNAQGEVLRDSKGDPVLECMCGIILRGRFNPEKAFFTPHGSFWSNSTSDLLRTTTEADRQARTRNRCNGEGYELVALIPLRSGTETFGLVQLNDKRRDRFTAESIARFERIADNIAVAIAKQRTGAALQESEARLKEAQQLAQIGNWEWNLDHHSVSWSDEVYRIFGKDPGTFHPSNDALEAAIHPDDRESFLRQRREMLEAKQSACIEHRIVLPDGEVRYVQERAQLVLNEAGEVSRVTGTMQDITERKQVEEYLRRSEAALKQAQRVSHVGSWVWNIKTNQLEWSDEMYPIFGIQKEGFSGDLDSVIAQAIYPDDRDKVLDANLRVINEKNPTPIEYRVIQPDQTIRTVWAEAGELILDEAGNPTLLTGIVQDITERKQAEETLRETQQLYEGIFRLSPEMIALIAEDDNCFLAVNDAHERITGYRPDEVIGHSTAEFMTWASLDEHRKLIQHLDEQGTVHNQEVSFYRRSGELYTALLSIARVEVGGKQCRINIIADITERKRAEEELERYRNHLEELVEQRTTELKAANEQLHLLGRRKDEFVSNVSHELRTPITSIKLRAVLLHRHPDQLNRHLGVIDREVDRLAETIENLLQLSRLDQNRIEVILRRENLNALVGQYVADRALLASDKKLFLTFLGQADLPDVMADAGLLGQVMSIMLTNAINYTPAGGEIRVQTVLRHDGNQPWAGFSVSDTGVGVPLDEQPHLFTRFFRGKMGRISGVPGTGLGLSIAKELVERHSGLIEVESDGVAGHGTIFRVWLPPAETIPMERTEK